MHSSGGFTVKWIAHCVEDFSLLTPLKCRAYSAYKLHPHIYIFRVEHQMSRFCIWLPFRLSAPSSHLFFISVLPTIKTTILRCECQNEWGHLYQKFRWTRPGNVTSRWYTCSSYFYRLDLWYLCYERTKRRIIYFTKVQREIGQICNMWKHLLNR